VSSSPSNNNVTPCSVYVVHTHITERAFGAQRQFTVRINMQGAALCSHSVRIYVFLYGSHPLCLLLNKLH